jgi:hypothetical protein
VGSDFISEPRSNTLIGAIAFASDRPATYGDDDVELAARIADHLALALAHEQLAEDGGRAAQAQERAAVLQERVDTLVQELDRRGGHRALGESPSWKRALVDASCTQIQRYYARVGIWLDPSDVRRLM